jgi:acetoin:2,6-dichlorophenolindophenol oxidoreductase subunit beta
MTSMLEQKEMTFGEAIRSALAEEMRRDPSIFLIGEDIGLGGGVFKVTVGLMDEFGPQRVIDSPISEAAITGIGVGAAITGMRPIVEIMFGDFITLAMDQIVNQAAKFRYMTGGQAKVPMVVRTTLGAGRSSAVQHSQSLYAWTAHIPGLKVVVPSTPYDAKGLLKSAIRDDNPVVFYEDKMMYKLTGPVPLEDYTIPIGVADVKRQGDDVTIIATSSMVHVANKAADILAGEGISVELVDPRCLKPLDIETLLTSAKKTGRVLVVDEGYHSYGITAEIAALISDLAFDDLDAPVQRLGAMDVPIPFSPALEFQTIPTEEMIVEIVKRRLIGRSA